MECASWANAAVLTPGAMELNHPLCLGCTRYTCLLYRYILGLYSLWDRILSAHPGLMIDDCSSGGRRIDLETLSRSFPLWRSDRSGQGNPTYLQVGRLCKAHPLIL